MIYTPPNSSGNVVTYIAKQLCLDYIKTIDCSKGIYSFVMLSFDKEINIEMSTSTGRRTGKPCKYHRTFAPRYYNSKTVLSL